MLDLIVDCTERHEARAPEAHTVFSQPGMRYSIAKALVYSLKQDAYFQSVSELDQEYIIAKILDDVKGRMLEDIVLLETYKAAPRSQLVFKFKFDVRGEYDMVIYDKNTNTCRVYEVKYSDTLYNHYDISQPDASVLHRGELVIDPIRHRLTLAGNEVHLRRREFRLLLYFAENPGIVLTPEKICETVWMTESHYNRDVSAVIAELRKKLKDDPKHPVYIETVHGVGYRFLPHK